MSDNETKLNISLKISSSRGCYSYSGPAQLTPKWKSEPKKIQQFYFFITFFSYNLHSQTFSFISNVTGHHWGPKQKLRLITEHHHYNTCHVVTIFHHHEWYHAPSLCYVCIQSLGIILTPYVTFLLNFVAFVASTAELDHGEKSHMQSLNCVLNQSINHPAYFMPGNRSFYFDGVNLKQSSDFIRGNSGLYILKYRLFQQLTRSFLFTYPVLIQLYRAQLLRDRNYCHSWPLKTVNDHMHSCTLHCVSC